MKAYGGVDVQMHEFLISSLVGGELSASSSGRFTSVERAPGTDWALLLTCTNYLNFKGNFFS
jgi:hypothetical protein